MRKNNKFLIFIGCIDNVDENFLKNVLIPLFTHDSRTSIAVTFHSCLKPEALENYLEKLQISDAPLLSREGNAKTILNTGCLNAQAIDHFWGIFENLYLSMNPKMFGGNWKPIFKLKEQKNPRQYEWFFNKLNGRSKILFLFKGLKNNTPITIGAFLKKKFQEKTKGDFTKMSGLIIPPTETSFFFYSIGASMHPFRREFTNKVYLFYYELF